MQSVLLAPHSPSIFADGVKEPQYITSRRPISAWVHLSSTDAEPDADKTDCVIGNSGILASNFNRIRINGFSCIWNIPNINPRNNTFKFITDAGPTIYTVVLAEAWWDRENPASAGLIADELIAGMNAAGSPLTFAKTVDPRYPNTFTIAATTPNTFAFVDCDAITKGLQMYGLRKTPLALTHQLGPMNMMYTQYVDIKSDTICKYAKMRPVTSGKINPIVLRAYVGGTEWGSNFQSIIQYTAFNWNSTEPLYRVDVKLFDQNGDQLYCPDGGKKFIWQLNLEVEV